MTYKKQDTFDAVASYLLRVRREAADPETGTCMYRTGLDTDEVAPYCAAGCLMTDRDARRVAGKHMNSITLMLAYGEAPSLKRHDVGLLLALQRVHDRSEPRSWQGELRDLALRNGFQFDLEKLEKLGRTQWGHVTEGPHFPPATPTPKLPAPNVNLKLGTEAA